MKDGLSFRLPPAIEGLGRWTPLATALGMAWGFTAAAAAAIVLYLLAGVLFGRLPATTPPE